MTQSQILEFLRDALFTALSLSAPVLAVSLIVGLIVSIFQAATQVNEQTLTFVPKLIAIALVLIGLGSWMLTTLADFFNRILTDIITLI